MSLIAWYPFTKDFRNQGLSTDTVTGTPVFVPSQFGQGLNLQGEKKSVVPELAGLKTFSVSYWVRINSDETLSSDWVNIVGLWDQNTTDTSGGSFRWQAGYGTYKDTMAVGGPYNSSQNNICSNMGTITADKNVWHHICAVVDYESNKVSSYLNGVLKNSTTHRGGHLSNGTIVFGGNNINGIINDFRVYNHALSVKEIKELAKGLILHHDLKGYGANPNVLPSTLISYGSIEEEGYRGQTVYVRDITTTTENYIAWGRIPQVEQSTQYTFSCYLWINDNVKSVDFYWLSDTETNQKTDGGYVNVTSKIGVSGITPDQWNYLTWTFTTPADDYTGFIRVDNNGSKTEGEHAILKACCPKLEKGSKATPYIPYGLINTDIEEDLSGNGFNGTRQGVTFTPDSPRYYMSTEFDANKDLILDRIFHQGDEVSNLSVSIWFKFNSVGGNIWNLNINQFWRIRPISNSTLQGLVYMNNGTQDVRFNIGKSLNTSSWFHFVTTFDKGIFKLYVDGILVDTVDKSDIATTIKCTSNTPRWSLGDINPGQEIMNGKLSDFRIYAKTLTADEVTELYKIGAQVDKTGKLYCGELVEE